MKEINKLIRLLKKADTKENGLCNHIPCDVNCGDCIFNDEIEIDIQQLLSEFKATQWISASIPTPAGLGMYDIVIGQSATIGFRFSGSLSWYNSEGIELAEDIVTHWKYRPQPPNEADDELE